MNRFYISPEEFKKEVIEIEGEDHKHLSKVLRLRPGEQVELYDGNNHQALGTILDIGPTSSRLEISLREESKRENKTALITLFQGYPKQNKLESIVQKNTELGVKRILPFYAKRSIPKPSKSESKKIMRLNRIAYEASKQCGRGEILTVEDPLSFKEMLYSLEEYDLILVPYENEENLSLKTVLNTLEPDRAYKIALIIGPEGGFDEDEISELLDLGASIVTLGPRILRTETAGMAAVSQINYALEND